MAAACVVCSDGKLREDSWLRCSIVGRGRATISFTVKGNRALPAAITTSAMSSAGRFQRRSSTKAIDSGASRTNDPASVTTHAIEVNVASRLRAIACMAWRSKPGAHVLTAIPARAVRTASPSNIPRTLTENAMRAPRLSMLVLDLRRGDDPEPSRHDLEDAWKLPSDLAVQGDVHGSRGPDPQPRNLERAKTADRPMHAKEGIECRAQQAADRQMLDHDDVESPVVRTGTRELEAEQPAKYERMDARKVNKAQPLGSILGFDLAGEDWAFLHRDRHGDRVCQPPESRTESGPCRKTSELHVDTGRSRMHEMARRLTFAGQLARVDARH